MNLVVWLDTLVWVSSYCSDFFPQEMAIYHEQTRRGDSPPRRRDSTMQQCAGFQIRQKELMSSGDQNAFYLEWKESNRWWALYILPISTLLAKTGKKDTWSLISIKKPQIVNDYNADMRGVDKLDQLIRSYNILMKCVHRLNTLLLLHGHLSCRHSLSTHPSTLHKCTFGSAGLPDGAWPTDSLTSCRVCRPPPTPKQLHPKKKE